MEAHKVKINGTLTGLGTEIFIDGQKLKNVRSIEYKVSTEQATEVTIDIMADSEIEAEALVKMYSSDKNIESLILNRPDEELLKFGNRILEELHRREHGEYDNKTKGNKNKK